MLRKLNIMFIHKFYSLFSKNLDLLSAKKYKIKNLFIACSAHFVKQKSWLEIHRSNPRPHYLFATVSIALKIQLFRNTKHEVKNFEAKFWFWFECKMCFCNIKYNRNCITNPIIRQNLKKLINIWQLFRL